jgi:hypothetical protein
MSNNSFSIQLSIKTFPALFAITVEMYTILPSPSNLLSLSFSEALVKKSIQFFGLLECVDHSSAYAAQLAVMIFEGYLDSNPGAAADSGPDGPITFSSLAV